MTEFLDRITRDFRRVLAQFRIDVRRLIDVRCLVARFNTWWRDRGTSIQAILKRFGAQNQQARYWSEQARRLEARERAGRLCRGNGRVCVWRALIWQVNLEQKTVLAGRELELGAGSDALLGRFWRFAFHVETPLQGYPFFFSGYRFVAGQEFFHAQLLSVGRWTDWRDLTLECRLEFLDEPVLRSSYLNLAFRDSTCHYSFGGRPDLKLRVLQALVALGYDAGYQKHDVQKNLDVEVTGHERLELQLSFNERMAAL